MTTAEHIAQRAMVTGSLLADEQKAHRHDAPARGYQTETCACGHPSGDHRMAGGYALHQPRHGVCLITGCECRGFQTARTVPNTTRTA